MSILYDYLKVLEKKRGQRILDQQTAAGQKKTVIPPSYWRASFVFLAAVLIVFLFFRNAKNNQPKIAEKIDTNQQSNSPIPKDSNSLVSNSDSTLDYSLNGIIYNSNFPFAIINGKLVEKNAKIGDWRVAEIYPSEVKLENINNNAVLTLKLNLSDEK